MEHHAAAQLAAKSFDCRSNKLDWSEATLFRTHHHPREESQHAFHCVRPDVSESFALRSGDNASSDVCSVSNTMRPSDANTLTAVNHAHTECVHPKMRKRVRGTLGGLLNHVMHARHVCG